MLRESESSRNSKIRGKQIRLRMTLRLDNFGDWNGWNLWNDWSSFIRAPATL